MHQILQTKKMNTHRRTDVQTHTHTDLLVTSSLLELVITARNSFYILLILEMISHLPVD